jgi:hypothetical protein
VSLTLPRKLCSVVGESNSELCNYAIAGESTRIIADIPRAISEMTNRLLPRGCAQISFAHYPSSSVGAPCTKGEIRARRRRDIARLMRHLCRCMAPSGRRQAGSRSAAAARRARVTFTAPASGMTWIFNPRGKATKSVRPYCRLKINTAEAAIDAAIAGVGVTNVLSYQIARAVAAGKLRLVLQDYEPDPIPVHLAHPG